MWLHRGVCGRDGMTALSRKPKYNVNDQPEPKLGPGLIQRRVLFFIRCKFMPLLILDT